MLRTKLFDMQSENQSLKGIYLKKNRAHYITSIYKKKKEKFSYKCTTLTALDNYLPDKILRVQNSMDVELGFPLSQYFMDYMHSSNRTMKEFIDQSTFCQNQMVHNKFMIDGLQNYANQYHKYIYSPLPSRDTINHFYVGNANKMNRYNIELYKEAQYQQRRTPNTLIDIEARFIHRVVNKPYVTRSVHFFSLYMFK